jgi:glucokinase
LNTPALIADIGGTNARFALAMDDGRVTQTRVLACADYADPAAAAQAFLADVQPEIQPTIGAFGVASAVSGDRIDLTNHCWSFSTKDMRERIGLDRLRVINDVEAMTLSVPHLGDTDIAHIGSGEPVPGAPIAAVAPGTGLGAAALIRDSEGKWIAVASEAGHASATAVREREAAIIDAIRRRFGNVSVERVVSGPGLVNLYDAICEIDNAQVETITEPAKIAHRGRSGECPCCVEALKMFSALFGTFAGDMALTFCARGGVFIGGGVVLKLGAGFDGAAFRRRFEDKGRFSDYLRAIPTYLITHETPALVGLAHAV